MRKTEIRPQPRQEVFLSSPADVCIYGGAAGGGKTWSILVEPLRHVQNPHFGAVIFRRTIPEITKEGALWDEAGKLYPLLGGQANQNDHQYEFPSGAKVTFAHLQHEKTLADWRGAQIPLICFDQLETFSEQQFFYMFSRNRSTCGVRPYIRATCNPEPNWLAQFLGWWIDEDGYAIPERSGQVRWMARMNEVVEWADSREKLLERFPGCYPRSVSFILSTVFDNQKLLSADPGYLSNLMALPLVDRERLMGHPKRGGNWKIKPAAGKIFNRSWFETVAVAPVGKGALECRYWDFAATEREIKKPDPDYTASVKLRKVDGVYYVLDYTSAQWGPAEVDRNFKNLCIQDAQAARQAGVRYLSRWEIEPGSAGIRESRRLVQMLDGIDAKGIRKTGDKLTCWKPAAAQAEAGNIRLVAGPWNEAFLTHLHGQPDLAHDDGADAFAGAQEVLSNEAGLKEARSYQG